MKLSNEVYDAIKKWVLPLLTGGATFYLTLGDLWHLPYTKEVAGTLTAIATLITYVLNQSSKTYFEDKVIVETSNDKESLG